MGRGPSGGLRPGARVLIALVCLTLGATFANAKPAQIVAAALPANLLAAVKATGATARQSPEPT